MQKHRRIADLLALRDRPDLTMPEGRDLLDALRIEIAAAWETSEVRRERPSPVDEARSGLVVFEQTLWDALPRFLRVLDERARHPHRARPADGRGAAALRVVDWRRSRRQPRGDRARDRDGLPVDALAGGEPVPARGRRAALRAVDERCQRRAARARRATPTSPIASCCATCARASPPRCGPSRHGSRARRSHPCPIIERAEDLAEPLRLCHRSLVETGDSVMAGGRLRDLLRRVAAFGATLVRLDLRQHASRHAEAMTTITRELGLGAYEEWSEARAPGVPAARAAGAAAAHPGRSRRVGRRARGARDVPHGGAAAGRVARRLRHLDGHAAVGRADRRAAAEGVRRRSAAARRAAVRDHRRPAPRRRHPARAAGAALVSPRGATGGRK